MNILILFSHPAYQSSRANRALVDAVRDLDSVTFRDLYEAYPDFNVDVAHEQRLLLAHDLIVFQHPFYWYSCPALLKEWQDLVLEHGFAYGEGGTALRGKLLLTAITTGGVREAYRREGRNYFEIRELLTPFEQTARLCGMRYLPPFVIHGVLRMDDEAMQKDYAALYRVALTRLRDGVLDIDRLDGHTYLNEVLEDKGNA